jgi:hypothetical protein
MAKIEVKVGEKFELGPDQDFWKDDVSKVFLRAPGKVKISKPKEYDFRSQLEWYTANRLKKNQDKLFFKDDPGNTWFEVTEEMNTVNIKKALSKGTLVPKGENKTTEKKEPTPLFKNDRNGKQMYLGPNKNIYQLLQKNKEKELMDTISKMKDVRLLTIMLDMEKRGWNPSMSPRSYVVELLEKQIKDKPGVSAIIEEETVFEEINK